jgi:ATP-dependent protease ClpP protease subunit
MKHPFISIENKNNVAELRIIGAISDWENNSKDFTRKVDEVLAQGVTDIKAYINCYGGSMFEANEIGNQVKRFPGSKTCKVGAIAASAGGYLTTYFDNIILSSNSQFMIHDPSVMLYVTRLEDFDSNKKLYENLRNDVIARFVKRTGMTTEEINTMMVATTWLNATETLDKGFADSIDSEEAPLPSDATNIFKNYKNVPTEMVALINNLQIPKTMNKILLALGLPANATEEQAIEALNALKQVGIDAIVALAVTKNLKKETIQKLANTNANAALEFVNEFEGKPTDDTDDGSEGKDGKKPDGTTNPNDLVKVLENHLKGVGASNVTKTLKDYSPAELENLAEKEPAKYEALIKNSYKLQ